MKKDQNEIKLFLQEEYAFRRNVLSGKIEYRELNKKIGHGMIAQPFHVLTRESFNSIVLAVETALPDAKAVSRKVETIIYSLQTPEYDPIRVWLSGLPQWDGKNYVGSLLDRIPVLRAEQRYWMAVWLRSMVAHWLQVDQIHANEVVPTFIGAQGCGKSTFCRMLLPEPLRVYFLDHVNLSNKFDKEMALTNNLLVNIDELDQVRRAQQAEFKQLLSKSRVNGRPIYGHVQDDRQRYASFVATTNNHHPLHDRTGSRRFLCIEIPAGALIDNLTPINYEQLYAQILAELGLHGENALSHVQGKVVPTGERYWFTDEEVQSLQRANAPYESTLDLERIVDDCFRQPAADEPCEPMPMTSIVDIVARLYPFIQPVHATKVQLGMALAASGFKMVRTEFSRLYYVIPRDAA